jgi:tetratricopeptide (TPR) repeat protein
VDPDLLLVPLTVAALPQKFTDQSIHFPLTNIVNSENYLFVRYITKTQINMKKLTAIAFLYVLFFGANQLHAQVSSLPPNGGNQKSVVRQYMGSINYVEVSYSSPDVAGREDQVWGALVPYGRANLGFGLSSEENPSPWRAGANENTTITFSHDMEIQGKAVKAGIYGFHVVPYADKEWEIILSSESNAWGSFFHVPEDEVLIVTAAVESSPYTEYLTFDFTNRKVNETTLNLRWEKKNLPITITVPNQNEIILQAVASELKNAVGFNHLNLVAVSRWASGAGFHDQAIDWAEQAISAPFVGQRDFTTLSTKAAALRTAGKNEESNILMDDAIRLDNVSAFQIHGYGRQLLAAGDANKALEVFQYNHKRFKGAWPTSYGLARGYSAIGNYKSAMKYLELALKNVPDGDTLNPPVIKANMEKLKNGEDIN